MENREAILADYFKLRLLLNRTNINRDQKTEIEIIILKKGHLDYRLIATLKGVRDPKYLELCKTSLRERWEPADYSGLIALEEFAADYLRRNLGSNYVLEEMNEAAKKLHTELQSLGISR